MNQSLIDAIHQEIDPFNEENWVDEEVTNVGRSLNDWLSSLDGWISSYELYGYGDPVGVRVDSGTQKPKGNFDKAHERALRGCHDKVYQAKSKVSRNFIKNHRKTCFSHK